MPPVVRSLLSSLTPRGRAALAAGAATVLALGLVAVVQDDGAPSAATDTALEREVITEDVDLTADLVGQRTSLASTGTTRTSAPTTVTGVVTASYLARPTLRPGNRGPAVSYLQKALRVPRTGWYGPKTLVAVVAFQKAKGLPAKGHVGALTWAAILAPHRTAATKATARVVKVSTPAAPPAPVTGGRICPAPGTAFGQGWGAARAGHSHQGLDLVGRRGQPLLAIEAGVVIREGRQSNGALRIVLQGRSGSKFYYGHMSKDLVHAGSRVRRGQVIGLMGDSGSPGAVHLHFEFWRSGGESAAVDPAPLLRSLC
jgi:murein DD-endopeptidase MepM/ murein hydrolase activator NlpD